MTKLAHKPKKTKGFSPGSYTGFLAALMVVLQEDSHATCDPQSQADAFAQKLLFTDLTRKTVIPHDFTTGEKLDNKLQTAVREKVTLQGFLEQERRNARFNKTATFGYDPFTGEFTSDLIGEQLLYIARDYVKDILGSYSEAIAMSNATFGNGASCLLPRAKAQDFNKASLVKVSTTRGNYTAAVNAISSSHVWSRLKTPPKEDPVIISGPSGCYKDFINLQIVNGAVYDTVPKDFKVNRVILKEPELNGFIQKGIGKLIRTRLREYGIDLNRSGYHNSMLAREGSITGLFATVDAERASDSITIALCEFLLPADWFRALMSARSPAVLIHGHEMTLDMMSGMGNGFTFELESVLFYAMGLAAARFSKVPFAHLSVSIHGDDLIIPADCFAYLEEAYTAAGIVINKEKTYVDGPYRESCGGHWFNGYCVSPVYSKKQTGRSRGDYFWLINSIKLWVHKRGPEYRESKCCKAISLLCKQIALFATDNKPSAWRTPYSKGLRAGLITDKSPIRTRSWKGLCVTSRDMKNVSDSEGAYVVWQNQPIISPSVLDLLKRQGETLGPNYEFSIATRESDGSHRYNRWDSYEVCGFIPPLWV